MTEGSRHAHVIRRPRVCRALAGGGGSALRLLCAPIGSGVSTALRNYAALDRGVIVLSASHDQTADGMRDALRACDGAREVLIDDADRLCVDAIDAVRAFALQPRSPRVMLAGHARARLRVHTLVASGDAELLDASALAFDAAETTQLAAALCVDAGTNDVADVLYHTEGWPVAVSWVVRDAAKDHRSLCGAFEVWADANGYLLREYIDAQIDAAALPEAGTLERVCAADAYDDAQAEMARLELIGYPIVRTRQGLRPYRVLRRIAVQSHAGRGRRDGADRLVLTLLGRFSARIGDREVAFMRRRDRNVLVYLALSPQGKVSRAELASIFWPEVPAAISSQGIRTTLSRLRHAIADAAGGDAGRYLRVGPVVALDLDRLRVDARRFAEHAAQARFAEERGDAVTARHHYLFAQRFAAGELLRSEAVDPALEPLVDRYAELAREVAERVAAGNAGAPLREAVDPRPLQLQRTSA